MGNKGDLVLSLRDQPRQEGSRKEHSLTWVVPEDWNTEVVALPPGATVPLEVAITSIDEGVLVEVSGNAILVGHCSRCLEPATVPMEIDAAEIYYEAPARGRAKRQEQRASSDIEITGDELDEELFIDQDTVDLEPLLRDELLSEAPFQPLCETDCLGLCEHCGKLLKDLEPGHSHEFLDPRFAALAALLDQDGEEGTTK